MTIQTDAPRTILYGPMMVPDSKWIKKALFYADDFATLTPETSVSSGNRISQITADLDLCSERGIWNPVSIDGALDDDKVLKLSDECLDIAQDLKLGKNLGVIREKDTVFLAKLPHALQESLIQSGHLREGRALDGQEVLESEYEGLVPALLTICTRDIAGARGWAWDVQKLDHAAQGLMAGTHSQLAAQQGLVTTIDRTLVPSDDHSVLDILMFREKYHVKFDRYMKALRSAEKIDQIHDETSRKESARRLNARVDELEKVARQVDLNLMTKTRHVLAPLARDSFFLSGAMGGLGGIADVFTGENLHLAALLATLGIGVQLCKIRRTSLDAAFLGAAVKNGMVA